MWAQKALYCRFVNQYSTAVEKKMRHPKQTHRRIDYSPLNPVWCERSITPGLAELFRNIRLFPPKCFIDLTAAWNLLSEHFLCLLLFVFLNNI